MLKKLLIIAGVVAGAAFIIKKVKDANEDKTVWHEATTTPELR